MNIMVVHNMFYLNVKRFVFLKYILFVLLLLCFITIFAVGCTEETNYDGLNYGKYVLDGSDDVYIEVKKDHKAYLNNLDFSDFNPEDLWGDLAIWQDYPLPSDCDITSCMAGEKKYYYFKSDFEFGIKILDNYPYGIPFIYNGENQLEFNGYVYTLVK